MIFCILFPISISHFSMLTIANNHDSFPFDLAFSLHDIWHHWQCGLPLMCVYVQVWLLGGNGEELQNLFISSLSFMSCWMGVCVWVLNAFISICFCWYFLVILQQMYKNSPIGISLSFCICLSSDRPSLFFLRHYACLYVCAWYLFGYQTKEEPSFSCVQTLLEAGRVLLVANVSDNERRDETNFVIRFFVFFRFLRSVFKFTQNCFAQRNPKRRVFLFCFILAKSRSGPVVVVLFVQIVFLYIQNAI